MKESVVAMAGILNKMLNFVGWEEEEEEIIDQEDLTGEELFKPQLPQTNLRKHQTHQSKVVNIHSNNQFKVMVMQPENFDDARDISEHLKNKKPVIINLEDMEKETAQRIVDFLSGTVYALNGNMQKVSREIIIIAPDNVDIMGDFKGELTNKSVFPWVK
jgi:cell division inhibitor SepF